MAPRLTADERRAIVIMGRTMSQRCGKALGVARLNWPARSPDLNIIENIWGLMKSHLAKKAGLAAANSDALWIAIQEEWDRLRQLPDLVNRLYDSLPTRIVSVKRNRGGTHFLLGDRTAPFSTFDLGKNKRCPFCASMFSLN